MRDMTVTFCETWLVNYPPSRHLCVCDLVSPQLVSSSCCLRRGCVCYPRVSSSSWAAATSRTPPSSGRGWVEPGWSTLSPPGVSGPIPAPAYRSTPVSPNSVTAERRRRGAATTRTERLDWLRHTCTWRNKDRGWWLEETCKSQSGGSMTWTPGGIGWLRHYAPKQVRGNRIIKRVTTRSLSYFKV